MGETINDLGSSAVCPQAAPPPHKASRGLAAAGYARLREMADARDDRKKRLLDETSRGDS